MNPSGIYPKNGTNAMITIMAAMTAANTRSRVLDKVFIFSSCYCSYDKDTMQCYNVIISKNHISVNVSGLCFPFYARLFSHEIPD